MRVGIEKENGLSPDSKMIVLHDFSPCVDDELKVLRGQIVNVLYRENDWVYVISDSQQQEGFIPFSYCAALEPQIVYKKKMPRSGPSSMVSSVLQDTMDDNHGCVEGMFSVFSLSLAIVSLLSHALCLSTRHVGGHSANQQLPAGLSISLFSHLHIVPARVSIAQELQSRAAQSK